ncbi:MAG: RNA methyltransferase [Gallionella sp.]
MRSIRSRDNPLFKELVKIAANARQRNKSGQTLLDGPHLVASYLDGGYQPRHVLVDSDAAHGDEIQVLLDRVKDVPITYLDGKLFRDISELKTSSGIIALIDIPRQLVPVEQSRFILLLEEIQDPGNLGSMLRSAAAAGCDALYLSAGCADAWSPKVLRAAMGGHFALRIHQNQDLPRVAVSFPGIKVATSLRSRQSLYDADLSGKVAFLIGNEGVGLSAELLKLASLVVTIPMHGRIESLNAAAATAICLFEAVRQRRGRMLE